ncbi:MAG TPA: hypothetical protein VGM74_09210 [Burkholderiaceae bacterium]|jgi:hypothetical protein
MNTISGIGSTNGAWSGMRSARVDRTFSLTNNDNSTGADDVAQAPDPSDDFSFGQGELDLGARSLMPAPSSTLEFAQQSGIGTMTPPQATDDDGSSSAVDGSDALDASSDTDPVVDLFVVIEPAQASPSGVPDGDSSGIDGSSGDASASDATNQALTAFIDQVMKQYGQDDAASNAASAGSLSVSA